MKRHWVPVVSAESALVLSRVIRQRSWRYCDSERGVIVAECLKASGSRPYDAVKLLKSAAFYLATFPHSQHLILW
jgi:hypothetical protein